MLTVPTAPRTAARAACLATAVAPILLTAACGAPGEPTACASPGSTFNQPILVHYAEDDELGWEDLILECTSDETVTITDADGNEYRSLEDFQANNDLFTEDDELLIPKDFPAVDRTGDVEPITVAGHTDDSAILWRVIGWAAAVAAIAGALMIGRAILRRRRDIREAEQWLEERRTARENGSEAE